MGIVTGFENEREHEEVVVIVEAKHCKEERDFIDVSQDENLG